MDWLNDLTKQTGDALQGAGKWTGAVSQDVVHWTGETTGSLAEGIAGAVPKTLNVGFIKVQVHKPEEAAAAMPRRPAAAGGHSGGHHPKVAAHVRQDDKTDDESDVRVQEVNDLGNQIQKLRNDIDEGNRQVDRLFKANLHDPNIKKAQDDIKEMKSRISVLETRKNKLLAVLNKEEEVARRMMATDKHAAPRRHHR